MLTIRMQRTGRKGYASFRVVVQDSRFSPSSGRVVAKIGHYNPHTKEVVLDKIAAAEYLSNGAQPSPLVTKLLVLEKVQLPDWVAKPDLKKSKNIRNPEKLRKNQPKEEIVAEAPVADDTPEEVIAEEIKEELAEIEEEIIAEEIAEVIVEEEAIAEAEADDTTASV